jgi:hypothetical protein
MNRPIASHFSQCFTGDIHTDQREGEPLLPLRTAGLTINAEAEEIAASRPPATATGFMSASSVRARGGHPIPRIYDCAETIRHARAAAFPDQRDHLASEKQQIAQRLAAEQPGRHDQNLAIRFPHAALFPTSLAVEAATRGSLPLGRGIIAFVNQKRAHDWCISSTGGIHKGKGMWVADRPDRDGPTNRKTAGDSAQKKCLMPAHARSVCPSGGGRDVQFWPSIGTLNKSRVLRRCALRLLP